MDEATYGHLDKQLRRHRNRVWAGRINGPMLIFLGVIFFIVAFDDTTSIWERVVSGALGLLIILVGVAAFRLQFKPLPPELADFQEYQRRKAGRIRRII